MKPFTDPVGLGDCDAQNIGSDRGLRDATPPSQLPKYASAALIIGTWIGHTVATLMAILDAFWNADKIRVAVAAIVLIYLQGNLVPGLYLIA